MAAEDDLRELLLALLGARMSPDVAASLIARLVDRYDYRARAEIVAILNQRFALDRPLGHAAPPFGASAMVEVAASDRDFILDRLADVTEERPNVFARPLVTEVDLAEMARAYQLYESQARGALIGVTSEDEFAYPAFQFTLLDGGRLAPSSQVTVRSSVESVNVALRADVDPYGALAWWVFPNGRLGIEPLRLLDTPTEFSLVEVARGLSAPIG